MLLILLILIIEEGRVIVLLHELLRWLVDIHLSHLLGSLFSSCLLGLFLLSLGSLDFLELLEDVLVMQKSVREFVLEDVASQETLNTALNHGDLQQLVDGGSLSRITFEHHRDDVANSRAEVRRQRRVVTLNNLLGQLMQRASVERRL